MIELQVIPRYFQGKVDSYDLLIINSNDPRICYVEFSPVHSDELVRYERDFADMFHTIAYHREKEDER